MNVIISEANVADALGICMLNKEELGYEYGVERTREHLEMLLNDYNNKILVTKVENDIVGYVHGNIYSLLYCDKMINVMGIAVLEKYKRNGIGQKLLTAIENWGIEIGASGIRLTSGEKRINAHKFYESCRYESHKMQKNFIKIF